MIILLQQSTLSTFGLSSPPTTQIRQLTFHLMHTVHASDILKIGNTIMLVCENRKTLHWS